VSVRVLLLDRGLGNPYSLGLASGLRSAGAQVALGGPVAKPAPDAFAVYPRYGMRGQRMSKAFDVPRAVLELARLVRRFRPEIVHFQWASALDLAYARLLRRLTRARLVFTVHNPIVRAGDEAPGLIRQARLLGLADAVIAHGPLLREQLCAAHPDLADRVHVVEHGNYAHVATRFTRAEARRKLGLSLEGPVYVFVGQLRPRKGLETLLDAYAMRTRAGCAGPLLVVGTATSPGYAASLQYRAALAGISPRWLVSLDELPHVALDIAVSAATQVVLPFSDASQSGSVILAMTHHRCVVTTSVGEVERTVSGRGILVAPDDPVRLAAALARAEQEPEMCDALGHEAGEYALTTLAWSRVAADTLAIYEGLR
jgi:glycosyltransferase involved in cell wall biosynthesis